MSDGQIISQAWKVWLATEYGKKCLTEPVSNPYLKNRLEAAFLEGWDACKRHYGDKQP